MELIEILKERKMTRLQLSGFLGVDDRTARKVIEKLRRDGMLIVNHGDGYFIPTKKSEASEFITEYYSHFKAMSVTLEIMLKEFERLPNE